MLLSALLACGCPRFEDMDVADADGLASPEDVDYVRQAIDAFAAWTGRDGVCVPEVRLVEEVDAGSFDGVALGVYRGPHRAIEVDADDGGLWSTTFHELCHALDHEEGHSAAYPWMFPETAREEIFPERVHRDRENFANYCEQGPRDLGLWRALDAACGTSTVSLAAAYVAEAVYPEAAQTAIAEEPVPLETTTRFLPLPDTAWVGDAAYAPDGLVLLASPAGDGDPVVRLVDPVDGTVRAEVAVPDAVALYPADEGAVAVLWVDVGDLEYAYQVALVDFDAGTFRTLDVPFPEHSGAVARSEGAVYVEGEWDGVATVRAWTTDGDEIPVSLPQEDWGSNVYADALWPEAGGVGMVSGEGVSRWDRATDTWTLRAAPPGLRDHARLPDGREVFRAWSATSGTYPVVHDPGAGTWALTTLPCVDISTVAGLPGPLVQAGDRVFAWGGPMLAPDGGVALALTELALP